MKKLLKWEEAAMFAFSIYLFSMTSFPWWYFLVLILLPDIGMLGYLIDSNIGAFSYNLLHHKGIALVLLICGYLWGVQWLEIAGIILFGHSSLDRILGYGLKFPSGFKDTHLGPIR
ncbi:MAG: DUF4260 domain-containing protein [Flavobacteriales bacterium]|nr:DUF4260 domain-containing protein [Flavobacteriales bacterium]